MSRPVLLVIPSQRSVYEKTLVKNATAPYALLAYATIAALPVRDGRQVSVLDLNLHVDAAETLRVAMRELDPAVVGLTAVTPLVHRAREIARLAKELRPEVTTVLGGPHLSSLPKETMETCPEFDLGVLGEGDFTFQEILKGRPPSELSGVAWRCEDGIGVRPPVEIDDLDTLPFPEWSVYDLRGYSQKEVRARLTPVGWLETSRGCVYRCCYCNKNVFGRGFRPKSPERVAEEFKYFAKAGFRSINIADDNFTTNIDRAARICELLIRNGNRLPWATVTGIRVNGVTLELFELMKRAGCNGVSFGIESGNQEILDRIPKNITLEQVRKAVSWARRAGLETVGYFMLALPGETVETMRETIRFACSLDLDLAKASITIPLPNTELYHRLLLEGRLRNVDWSNYNVYVTPSALYTHDNLDWNSVDRAYRSFYRTFYFRPHFMLRRLAQSLGSGTFMDDLRILLSTRW
jgi:anaerobic magnesium-protoporphyrin IX monomethyl ester cyclase